MTSTLDTPLTLNSDLKQKFLSAIRYIDLIRSNARRGRRDRHACNAIAARMITCRHHAGERRAVDGGTEAAPAPRRSAGTRADRCRAGYTGAPRAGLARDDAQALVMQPVTANDHSGSSASFQSERSTASTVAQPDRTAPMIANDMRACPDGPRFSEAAKITATSGSTTTK